MLAYVTRYIFGTDKLRTNAFEVRGMNGANSGVIHCADAAVLSHWIKIVTEYVNALTSYRVSMHINYLVQGLLLCTGCTRSSSLSARAISTAFAMTKCVLLEPAGSIFFVMQPSKTVRV